MMNSPFIGIAGNIGVGKTTFTSVVAKRFNLLEVYESVSDNPYLSDFYGDMKRWSFNLQIYFLHHRFSSINNLSNHEKGIVQDRTIYEDVEIFSKNLFEMGSMDKRDWDTYSELFINMTKFLKKPDLIIYLRADLEVLLDRIKTRSRNYEATIDPDYINKLNKLYDDWIKNINGIKAITIDTNNFNVFKDTDQLEEIMNQIENALQE